jgi:hypothetical protein
MNVWAFEDFVYHGYYCVFFFPREGGIPPLQGITERMMPWPRRGIRNTSITRINVISLDRDAWG